MSKPRHKYIRRQNEVVDIHDLSCVMGTQMQTDVGVTGDVAFQNAKQFPSKFLTSSRTILPQFT